MNLPRILKAKTIAAISAGGLAIGVAVALPASSASAGTCTNALGVTSTTCTSTGTITLAGGLLTMGGPTSLTWTGAVTGAVQTLYDASSSNDQTLYSSDLRGLISTSSGSGWNITASGTQFTGTATSGNATLPTTGVLSFGGGNTSALAAQRPTAACIIVATCTLPTASGTPVTYPVGVPTSGTPTPTKIYQAAAGTGTGGVQIGGGSAANPATWAVTLPALVAADTYTSTVTLTIASGP